VSRNRSECGDHRPELRPLLGTESLKGDRQEVHTTTPKKSSSKTSAKLDLFTVRNSCSQFKLCGMARRTCRMYTSTAAAIPHRSHLMVKIHCGLQRWKEDER